MTTLLLSAATALAIGGAAKAQDFELPPNSFDEVAPGVWSLMLFGVNSMVVVGEDGVLVTDPAVGARAQMMIGMIAEVTDKPITHVALSHEHYDHAGGADVFEGAEVIAHENVPEVLAMSRLFPMPEVNTTFDDTHSVDLGGISVDMYHLGHGDGTGTAIMHVPEADVVFSADMYEDKSFTAAAWKEDTNLVGLRDYLNKMVELEPVWAINTHQPGNALEALKENAELQNKIYDQVFEAYSAAVSQGGLPAGFPLVFSLPSQISMPEYSEWNNYEQGLPGYVNRMSLSLFHGG